MAAQNAESRLFYRVPEDAFHRIQLVRDSLSLLMDCTDDSPRGSIDPKQLASHLQLIVENLNGAIEMASWNGKGA